ncbi:hypothetical protein ONZ45_g4721 [Pleurotus djamor]|nr:hypothetical protein ONZ45_g4721 [Pleurotus djamor]
MRANTNDHHPILQLAESCSSTLISLHILTMIPHQTMTAPDLRNARSEQFIRDLATLRNLEVLNTSVIWPYPSLLTVWRAVDGMNRLEILRIDGLPWPHQYLVGLDNTNLRRLSISVPLSSHEDLHLPNLEEISFLSSRFDPEECPKFSGNVERLTLYTGSEWSLAGLLSSDWLSLHFPRIRRLDILVPDWADMNNVPSPLTGSLPEGLTHVGLTLGGKVQGAKWDYLALKNFCAAVASSATQIEAVQMLSRQTCVDLTRRHPVVLDSIISALHTSRLRLLDSDGKPFPPKVLEGDRV